MPAPKWSAQSAADIFANFMQQGGGIALDDDAQSMDANVPLEAAALRSTRNAENRERMIHDPSNPSWQMADKFIREDEAADPYSDTSSGLRATKAQDATDVMNRFFAQQPMRDQQNVDAGHRAEDVSYGTHQGDYRSRISPEGTNALDAAGRRDVNVANAKAKGAAGLAGSLTKSNILSSGGVDLPPGMKSDSANALVNSDRAQLIFKQNGADEGTQGIVGLILDYRLTPPQAAALARSGQMQKYLGLAKAIDGQFDPSMFETGMKLRQDMTTGVTSKQLTSLARIGGHLDVLAKDRDTLGNTDAMSGLVNPVKNAFGKFIMGDDRMQNYDKAQSIVDAEAATAMSASGAPSDAARRDQAAGVTSNSSHKQQAGHAATTRALLDGQETAIRNKVGAVPRLLPLLEELLNTKEETKLSDSSARQNAPAPAQSGPAVGQKGSVNGVPAIWNGTNWVRDRSAR